MRAFTISVLFLGLLADPSVAQAAKAADDDNASIKSTGVSSGQSTGATPAVKIQPRSDGSPQATFSQWEWWTNFTIPAGGTVNLDSQLDYSTTDTVRVTIRSAGSDLGKVALAAYWAIPDVPFYGVADVVGGNTLPYSDAGGATFNTYGSQFRLRLINNGNSAVTISQVLMFSRVH